MAWRINCRPDVLHDDAQCSHHRHAWRLRCGDAGADRPTDSSANARADGRDIATAVAIAATAREYTAAVAVAATSGGRADATLIAPVQLLGPVSGWLPRTAGLQPTHQGLGSR